MTIEEWLRLRLVDDPQLSPDGSAVVYVVPEVDESTCTAATAWNGRWRGWSAG